MCIEKVHLIRRRDRIESELAEEMGRIAEGFIEGFGCSDTDDPSHLFYFKDDPRRDRRFMDVILDFQTFVH